MNEKCKKTTEQLLVQIKENCNIEHYIQLEEGEFINDSLVDRLRILLEKYGVEKAEVIRRSGQSQGYMYQVFAGQRQPSRDKLLALIFGFELPLSEAQKLLRTSGFRELYPRDRRDAMIIHALEHKNTVSDLNLLLHKNGWKLID